MNHASKRPGWGFWLLWVAASTVGFVLGSIAHGNAGKLLTDASPAVIATIVTVGLYPLIATLPGFLHWLILRRWFPHAGWWVLARIPTDRFGVNRFGLVGSSEAGFSGVGGVQGVSLLLNW